MYEVFILDEASILSRYGLENIDAKLRELHNNNEVPFGGPVLSIVATSDGATFSVVSPSSEALLWAIFKSVNLLRIRADIDEIDFND